MTPVSLGSCNNGACTLSVPANVAGEHRIADIVSVVCETNALSAHHIPGVSRYKTIFVHVLFAYMLQQKMT